MKPIAELPGAIVSMSFHEDALFVVFEQPRRWWHRKQHYGVRRFAGQEIEGTAQ